MRSSQTATSEKIDVSLRRLRGRLTLLKWKTLHHHKSQAVTMSPQACLAQTLMLNSGKKEDC